MTTKADFTEEEWARLERSPLVATMAISLADPGGPIEAVKESMAAIKSVNEAQTGEGLVAEVARSFAEKTKARQSPIRDFKPSKGALAGQEILDELRAANELVTQKATAEEAQAFRAWLLQTAQRAAEAAKEGGFLGFKAERVSQGEKDMLAKLEEVFAA